MIERANSGIITGPASIMVSRMDLLLRQIRSHGGRSLREKRRGAREQREDIFHSESAVTIGSER